MIDSLTREDLPKTSAEFLDDITYELDTSGNLSCRLSF